jgi:hypothetical protein
MYQWKAVRRAIDIKDFLKTTVLQPCDNISTFGDTNVFLIADTIKNWE